MLTPHNVVQEPADLLKRLCMAVQRPTRMLERLAMALLVRGCMLEDLTTALRGRREAAGAVHMIQTSRSCTWWVWSQARFSRARTAVP